MALLDKKPKKKEYMYFVEKLVSFENHVTPVVCQLYDSVYAFKTHIISPNVTVEPLFIMNLLEAFTTGI